MNMVTDTSCVQCGGTSIAQFTARTLPVVHQSFSQSVEDLSGSECQNKACGEITFDAASSERFGAASDAVIVQHRNAVGQDMKRIRKKLGLTQGEMVTLFAGGGHNSISRYERGEIEPPKALQILMGLLDRHPELLDELRSYA